MNNVRGILLVLLAMVGFTLEDTFIKALTGGMAVGQVLMLIGLGSASVFALFASVRGENILGARAWQPLPLLRAFTEAFSAVAYATALSKVDISTVAAVFQATPLVITMGAALFLGEQVGWRRWSAIGVGFIGVIMIIRPGLNGFEPAALWVLIAVLGVATRDLLTRVLSADVPSTVVSFQAFATIIPAGLFLMFVNNSSFSVPHGADWAMIVGGVLFGVMGYYSIVVAMRIGDAAVVTPFRYTRLLFSILIGAVVFAERPDLMTLAGSSLVIGSGLYTFLRERRLQRVTQMANA
ncbi:EamA family transporter [Epibacterium sp. SM1969]|uniref:EamA family transporter n=1 Tax=Tritonibacter aquimaris TaxID=2663379 RepID=A0A844AJP2_9RHOB|nr:DMT family transporter [Tritonibacter aquimaris]MQY41235.1 EamA family transporter [Tritonibacter aquimaris]